MSKTFRKKFISGVLFTTLLCQGFFNTCSYAMDDENTTDLRLTNVSISNIGDISGRRVYLITHGDASISENVSGSEHVSIRAAHNVNLTESSHLAGNQVHVQGENIQADGHVSAAQDLSMKATQSMNVGAHANLNAATGNAAVIGHREM